MRMPETAAVSRCRVVSIIDSFNPLAMLRNEISNAGGGNASIYAFPAAAIQVFCGFREATSPVRGESTLHNILVIYFAFLHHDGRTFFRNQPCDLFHKFCCCTAGRRFARA